MSGVGRPPLPKRTKIHITLPPHVAEIVKTMALDEQRAIGVIVEHLVTAQLKKRGKLK